MSHDNQLEMILNHIRTAKCKNLILDTDTYNEIDDQFAITYAMLAEDVNLLALTAAPFLNEKSVSPADGMEKSYEEMIRVRDLVDPDSTIPCYRGSRDYLKTIITPQPSEAAENIIRLVKQTDGIVYIAVIGCYTNVASALLMEPSIMDKIVILMVGANKFERGDCNEFNLWQDRCAARVIFECGVPLVVLPAFDGTERIYTTTGEVHYYLNNKAGAIGNYLCRIFAKAEGEAENADGSCCSRQRSIWDIASIAFLRDPDRLCDAHIVPARTIDAQGIWRDLNDGRNMIYVDQFHRNEIFSDFFTVVRKATANTD